MYAWLLYNGALTSPMFMDMYNWYQRTAQKKGIELELMSNVEAMTVIENNNLVVKNLKTERKPEFVLFLDKDIRLAKTLELQGIKLFNSMETIQICDDKSLTFQALSNHNIKMPKTLIAPMMFSGTNINEEDFIKRIEAEFDYPIIIKESFGSFGAQVYLVKDRYELEKKREEIKYIPHLYQEFIKPSYGKDLRLFVVGEQVVATMLRVSTNDFRANISSGGTAESFNPTQEFIDLALRATKILKADFAGVDILFGEGGEPVLCEVNSNAHIKGVYTCTGVDVTENIFEYILNSINCSVADFKQ